MKTQGRSRTVRRSIALPQRLEDQIRKVACEYDSNVNRTVVVALEEFVQRRRHREFQRLMNEMGADPEIRKASRSISRTFATADTDGPE